MAACTPDSRIEVRGLRVLAHVGVPATERAQPQPLEIDLDLHVDVRTAAASDDVADTADYGAVLIEAAAAATAGPHALLERVALVVGEACLAAAPLVTAVDVTVRKLRVPVPVDVVSAAVRLRVERG